MLEEENEAESFFKQNLKNRRLEVSPRLYIVIFSPMGMACLVIGMVLFFSHDSTIVIRQEYGSKCHLGETCLINISIRHPMEHPIAVMYEISGFFQNHLFMMRSRSDAQLMGEYVRFDDMKICSPYRSINDDPSPNKWILPCGLQAYSFFNDTLDINDLKPLNGPEYQSTGIIAQPLNSMYMTGYKWLEEIIPWPDSHVNQRFSSWMDTAAFSNVRRVWGITSDEGQLSKNITITVLSNFDTGSSQTKKYIVLSTKGSHPDSAKFLGIFYLAFGSIMEVLVIIVLSIRPKSKF